MVTLDRDDYNSHDGTAAHRSFRLTLCLTELSCRRVYMVVAYLFEVVVIPVYPLTFMATYMYTVHNY